MANELTTERMMMADELAEDEIDLRQLWLTIYRRKWSIISLVVLVVMLTTLWVSTITPIYSASTTLLIEQKSKKVVSIEEIYGADARNWYYMDTQLELLSARSLAEKVVAELGLRFHPEFDPAQQPEPKFQLDWRGWLQPVKDFIKGFLPTTTPEDLQPPSEEMREQQIYDGVVSNFMGRINLSLIGKSQLVAVSIQMADAQLAATAANALANNFISGQLDARADMTLTATSWMNERLAELKTKLQESESLLQVYRERENLLDVEGVTTVSADALSQTNTRLIDARKDRAAAESKYRQVKQMKKAGWRSQSTVPAVLTDPLVQTFKSNEAKAKAKVDELSRRYGEKHPKMIAARSDLDAASLSLQGQVEQVVASIERDYQLARQAEGSLSSSLSKNKGEIQDIKRKEFKLRELQREVESNRQLYDTFLTRLKETSATTDLDTANARIVDLAVVPRMPISPKKQLIMMVAGLLSLMVGIGLAILLDVLSNTFKSTEDVENNLNLPVLGIVPLVKKGADRKVVSQLYMEETDKGFSESFRSIRTGVVLSGLDNPHKVIVVTSSVPGEGKSCIASNLAFSLGQLENVLLIDADMRRPTVQRNFEIPAGTPGLARLVAETASYEECVQTINGIDVIPVGLIPPNPLELLSSEHFAKFIADMESKYDRIVIDSPPVQAVSDALVLSKFSNTVIYVIKSDSTPIPQAKKGIGLLVQNKAPIGGIVLNQVDIKKAQKYGYTYSGYYDYYGYSGEKKTKGA